MLRRHDRKKVRDGALAMAVRKGAEGCEPCAQRYFELARTQGARWADIEHAIDSVGGFAQGRVSRANLLRLAMGGAAGLALGGLYIPSRQALASSYYWGTDTNTYRANGGPPGNFYIGRAGYGTTQNWTYFNTSAATLAGYLSTYMYWDLEGPGSAGGQSNYNWGYSQADAAISAWNGGTDAQYVGGDVIFADVESGNPGWGSNTTANQQVLQGWLDSMAYYSFIPGVYISPSFWAVTFGESYRPTRNFVLWITGCQTCGISTSPCSGQGSTTESQVESMWPTISRETFGGSQVVLWQYWIGNCGCGDYNVTTQNPANGSLSPVNNSTTWYCTGCGASYCA